MKNMLKPIGAMLVGLAFILSCIWSSAAASESLKNKSPESLDKVKDFHTKFTSSSYFVSDQGRPKLPFQDEMSCFSDDTIIMNGTSQPLDGLISINGIKRRSASYDGFLPSANYRMNAMDITVSGITVIAINMVEGGSAVASSDIVLRPVQILSGTVAHAEVDEKLR